MKRPFLVLCTVLALLSSAAHAADDKKSARVPVPVFKTNTDKGEKCVEPTGVMRRDHMQLILHQRDKTMHEGVRTTKHSLKNCVDCHADAKTGSVLGKDGFCESCHAYAAVKLDCFECHSALREAAVVTAPSASSVRALGVSQKKTGEPTGSAGSRQAKGKKP
ncbi:MAG TPA: hypothetical protein VJ396_03350 [Acidiferrobacterales bacterium]|nr:hypothetical protein [Acidiferrobacterales bacterium]